MNTLTEFLEFNKGLVDVNHTSEVLSPLQNRLIREIREKGLEIDCIYFSGEYPSIYYKKVNNFNRDTLQLINEIHKKIWNQGKVPFLYIDSPAEIRIYNCYHRPINPEQKKQKIDQVELFKATKTDEEKLSELKEVFGLVAIETGQFWKKPVSKHITNKNRVNKALIENLKITRKRLISSIGKKYENVVHDLLIRSLFILYLEDRGATDKKLYNGHKSYLNVLDDYEATYQLFDTLEKSFNGNLSPVSGEEKRIIKDEHLQEIKACFWDTIIDDNGQKKFPFEWKPFDFKYIPIEFISEIYEEFLTEIEGEEKKSKDGVYYTPHTLVEFILNKILPWADENNRDYNIKILDPTCGSGIFLVEALKRLIDRWEYKHPERKISFKDLTGLLKNNIYGFEIKKEAIKVAAFSLYLTILDKLEPKTLWQQKKFPYLLVNPEDSITEKKGTNLFCMSSLNATHVKLPDFDLITGNPPFKRGNLNAETRNYLKKKGYAQESAFAFLDKALELCPNGKIAMIAPSKAVLFNTSKTYQKFREFLFNKTYVEEVINLSILRKLQNKHGGQLFVHAVGPSCILFYQKQIPAHIQETITYYAPKTTVKNNIIDGIVFDQTDIKYLPRKECQKPDTKIWKIAMWGTMRDFLLINRLQNHISLKKDLDRKKENGWNYGNGYQISNPCSKVDKEISILPTIETKYVRRYITDKNLLHFNTPQKFRRLGDKKTYIAPHLLCKKGQTNKRFCASLLNFDCAFKDGVYGISTEKKNTKELKVLTAYLNSKFASYFLFLNISSFGIEREQIMLKEYLDLPSILNFISKANLEKMVLLFDKISENKKSLLENTAETDSIINKIDDLIFSDLKINNDERKIIDDIIDYNLNLFTEKNKSIAYKNCSKQNSKTYAKTLCAILNQFLAYGSDLRVTATIYDIPSYEPLHLIILHFTADTKESIKEESSTSVNSILAEINKYTYKPETGTIYFRKVLRYYSDDKIYIIKPNEKRFWSRSMAMSDADAIIQEIVSKK